jgi:hypothetical protein
MNHQDKWDEAMAAAQAVLLTEDQETADAVMFGKGPSEAELAACQYPPDFNPTEHSTCVWSALRQILCARLVVMGWETADLVAVCHFDRRTINRICRAERLARCPGETDQSSP